MKTPKRKARTETPNRNFLKPLIGVEQDGCFGKLWSLESEVCRLCADNVSCGALMDIRVKRDFKALLEKFDVPNIATTTRAKIYKFIVTNPGIKVDVVIEKVINDTKVEESVVVEFLKALIKSYGTIYTEGGVFKIR